MQIDALRELPDMSDVIRHKQVKQVSSVTSTFISMFAGKYPEIKQCDSQHF